MALAKKKALPELHLADLPTLLRATDGWAALRAALGQHESGTIDGAWGSSAALAAATLAREKPPALLIVVPNVTDVGPWAEDLACFLGERPFVFPAWETWPPPTHQGRLAPETAERLRVLQKLGTGELTSPTIIAPMAAVIQPVPPRADLANRGRTLTPGEVVDVDDLAEWLVGNGYKRVEAVEYPGEFAKRGGIVDLFPPDSPDPVRLEFFGDELESIRLFAAQSQRSLEKRKSVTVIGIEAGKTHGRPAVGFLAEYLSPDTWIVLVEPGDLKEQGKHFFERVADPAGLFTVEGVFSQLMQFATVTISVLPRASVEASWHLHVESVERFSGNVQRVRDELDTVGSAGRVLIACQSEAEVHRLTDVLKAGKLSESHRLALVTGHVKTGFRLVGPNVVVLGSHEIFHKDLLPPGVKDPTKPQSSRRVESRAIDSFLDLNEGDYVVHVAHGIARFRGMRVLEKTSAIMTGNDPLDDADENALQAVEENLMLEFRDGVFLYVPASRIDLIQKYVGGNTAEPTLSKLGGTAWGRKKAQITEAVRDMAAEMIQIQAVRASLPGTPLPADSDWQREFEAAFPYQETPDQLAAINETKADLEKPRPLDRLICGDVGYGKTEVAIRAAFKVIDNGKQVAVLVPTTILAEQHFRNFSQRFAEYPFVVECLSRFRSAAQQRDIVRRVKAGEVDVVVGTHRVVGSDVAFPDLGLVVIDEEQRFGVEHKEKLKRLRSMVHVLTMSATPIPRTLHSALLGIREISNLETPPPERMPIETRIIRWDDQMIRHAILRELNRGGQAYFVHNRVHDILEVVTKIKMLVPEARVVYGHGQMNEHQLEAAMVTFLRKEADILVATTIIESGLDIPSANTIFIDDADNYGLADLHQLRGRVGRQKLRAYAYLIVNPLKLLTPTAQKRLKAIEEFTELGAGFKISMRDLEIRGAGNILGTEQSGHIAALGYEMYCTLLENAVRQLKNLPPKVPVEVHVDLPWPAFLPRDYVPGQKLRIEVYRRLSRLREVKQLADFRSELADRYGPPPPETEWLLRTTEIRLHCVRWQISSVNRNGRDLVFGYKSRAKADELSKKSGGRFKAVDEKSCYLRLKPEEDSPEAMYELLKKVLS
ncbi:transcription-repair coupling factor [Limnoglobus roseus]|uniref:Transcription-repair-coupling factor n=1 Tax=Limnoglobus roseus TaxID=2598579 RepID=A0A5C1AP26_9BACT|nr:transcription-repair coupling factor [Limnoglobus roseus]QEL20335.1 transcription-repair coupling factor [Limnoglobus roseus]